MARKNPVSLLINPVSFGPVTRHIKGAHAVRAVISSSPRATVSGIKAPKPPKAKLNKLITGQQGGQKKAVTKNPRRPLPPPTQRAQQANSTQQTLKVLRSARKIAARPPRIRITNRLSPGHGAFIKGFHRH